MEVLQKKSVGLEISPHTDSTTQLHPQIKPVYDPNNILKNIRKTFAAFGGRLTGLTKAVGLNLPDALTVYLVEKGR